MVYAGRRLHMLLSWSTASLYMLDRPTHRLETLRSYIIYITIKVPEKTFYYVHDQTQTLNRIYGAKHRPTEHHPP